MWTPQHRARHAAHLKQIVAWHAVREVAGWLERADPPRSPSATPTLAVVGALAWHLRVGGSWRSLPPGMPPWRTVYGWFRRWASLGLFEHMMRDLTRLRRRAAGRRPAPTLAIIDTQSVKCLSVRGPRGFDPAKRLVGRKRVAMVDAEGFPLAIALPALDKGKEAWPSLRLAILDGVFDTHACRLWSNLHGMQHEVVRRPPGQKGFAALPRRWVIERSFAWLTPWGGLLRDRAGRLDVSTARLHAALVLTATEALINPE
jgi:putative transposase